MKPWHLKKSKYVLKDRWIAVRADECVTEHGHVVEPYYVFDYPDWIHLVAFDQDMRVLLIRLYRHGTQSINWEIPAGVVEDSEEPVETAKRELMEETGCKAERYALLGSLTPNSATHRNRVHCLVAYGCRKVADPSLDDSEDIESAFTPVKDLLQMIDTGEFFQALHIAAIMLALRHAGLLKSV